MQKSPQNKNKQNGQKWGETNHKDLSENLSKKKGKEKTKTETKTEQTNKYTQAPHFLPSPGYVMVHSIGSMVYFIQSAQKSYERADVAGCGPC